MKLIESLTKAVAEKDVENTWRAFLSKYYECDITSPYKTDGHFEHNDARVLCEFKDDINMSDNASVFGVVAQSLYYLKKFQDDGAPLPNVIFAADKNECFVLGTHCLFPYLNKPYDWSVAPSLASKQIGLMADLIKDDNVIPVVFNLDNKFSFDPVELCIQNTSMQAKSETPITAQNITRVFEYWVGNVLHEGGKKMEEKDVLDTFLTLLCQPQECYVHPKKAHFLMVGNKEVRIRPKMYCAFFTLYKETHNPLELREITANKDRLLQEVHRRRTGAFFTPSLWVDEAHNMIAEQFGEDWKEKYVVWDCSCGTLNLTRDYKFKELYCSTLDQSDLDLATLRGYNPEAVKFQFDFLNDDETKLPDGLKKALAENKPIIFLNNPPYGTAQNLGRDGDSKADISISTKVYAEMSSKKIGGASQNLYAQFMYRISQLMRPSDVMATFSKANFITGKQSNGFRGAVLEKLSFKDGMMFQASHFSDVAASWAVAFTLFSA